MNITKANGIEICYETTGERSDPAVLLVMGLGAQLIAWPDGLCDEIAGRGFFVVRYDNRDVGLSTKVESAYTLADMAADGIGLLDALGIDRAHVVGASLGGMVVQRMAIDHPARVLSLTSIMSTTGGPTAASSTPEAMQALLTPPPTDRAGYVEHSVRVGRIISGALFDETRSRELAGVRFDRAFYPQGTQRQMAAVMADGDRTDGLRTVSCPALVIHGRADPLVGLAGGEATAAAIPGAELVVFDEMGHDLPQKLWGDIASLIAKTAARA